jgi:nucleotidyltransferase substrate binding protein (TIGR01987 family)
MGDLNLRVNGFLRIARQLHYMLQAIKNARANKKDEFDILAYRDSSIKRFEICHGIFWKILKDYLYDNFSIDIASPKKVFQECFKQKLITAEEEHLLAAMADDRNTLAHEYDETGADKISQRIESYLSLMKAIVARLSQKD